MTLRSICLAALATSACSHPQQTAPELDRVQRPAYVGRLDDGAGPRAQGVAGTAPSEAQLLTAMNAAIGRFEVSERLRSQLAVALRPDKPWSNAVPASQVASALETFLVEHDPPLPPEYSRLKPTGADAVLEVVVQDYGLRAQGGDAQSYLRGYAHLFLLADGTELWRSEFQRSGGGQALAPLKVAALGSNADPYGDQLRALLDAAALELAKQLSPAVAARLAAPGAKVPLAPVDQGDNPAAKPRAPAPDLTQPTEAPVPTDRTKPKAPDLTAPSEQPVTPK